MSVEPFRVKILLNNFFNDHREKAFVSISESWKTVADLMKHIKTLFNIKLDIFATSEEVLLPNNENINVISASDIIT